MHLFGTHGAVAGADPASAQELEATATEDELAAEQVVGDRSRPVVPAQAAFRSRYRACRGHGDLDHDRRARRRRSAAWLRACAHQRPRRPQAGRASAPGTGESPCQVVPKRREPRGHMRSSGFSAAEKWR